MSSPVRIDATEWQRRFLDLAPETRREPRYLRHLGEREWAHYLKPPSSYLPYGFRRLRRMRFDGDVRALRLFSFAMEETERLFRAKQEGLPVVALMGDYGAVAPLLGAFPGVVTFYPDFCYFTPFLAESDVLLDRAERLGIGEDTCYVRAAAGAFAARANWPDPDLVVVSTGASCDDLAATAQAAHDLGHPTLFLDIPCRKDPAPWLRVTRFEPADGRPPVEAGLVDRLVAQYREFLARAGEVLGQRSDEVALAASVSRARRMRRTIREIRGHLASAPAAPLPAYEAMLAEFAATHGFGDPDECEAVLAGVRDLVAERAAAGVGVLPPDAARVVWATPPPDPLLFTLLEDAGGRVAGSEYLIASALTLPPDEPDPVVAVARAFLAGSLLGSSAARAKSVVAEVRRANAEGVVISNLFGSSHCGAETPVIRRAVEEECGLPVLSFDVPRPAPGGVASQVKNRVEAFVEALTQRRRTCGRP
ncbi:MAG: 2-hydroxyacyl-CoA dehydratase family protein [Planctomycetes bacterium]|nr:2-hydroxyacyl-CoA dehydratase family protein [Planctomycetota bacterium]